jgi:hypothetical protein
MPFKFVAVGVARFCVIEKSMIRGTGLEPVFRLFARAAET